MRGFCGKFDCVAKRSGVEWEIGRKFSFLLSGPIWCADSCCADFEFVRVQALRREFDVSHVRPLRDFSMKSLYTSSCSQGRGYQRCHRYDISCAFLQIYIGPPSRPVIRRRSLDHGRIIPKRWACVIDEKKKKI